MECEQVVVSNVMFFSACLAEKNAAAQVVYKFQLVDCFFSESSNNIFLRNVKPPSSYFRLGFSRIKCRCNCLWPYFQSCNVSPMSLVKLLPSCGHEQQPVTFYFPLCVAPGATVIFCSPLLTSSSPDDVIVLLQSDQ